MKELEASSPRHRSLPKEVRVLLVATLVVAALIPAVPDAVSVETVTFSALFVALTGAALARAIAGTRQPLAPSGLALMAFFGSLLFSFVVGSSNGVPTANWIRGAVPFLFLSTLYLFRGPIANEEVELVLVWLFISCCAWILKILLLHLGEFISGDA